MPSAPEPPPPGSSIAYCTAEEVWIRDRGLVRDLMGEVDFTTMLVFHLTGRMPEPGEKRLIDAILVMLMEHGWTPSSIAARLVYMSSPDALQGAVAAGLLGAGSVFLGAMEEMAAILQRGVILVGRGEASSGSYAREVIQGRLQAGATVPGFGHHIHRPDDPRTPKLLELARQEGVSGPHVELLAVLASTMDELKGRHVTVNATAAVGAVLSDLGYPWQIMRGFSLIARAAGLVGHLLEEQQRPLGRELWDLVDRSFPYTPPAAN